MKKLAIIGASYLQNPLIEKARSMGIETHVFAWAAGDIGEKTADYFYPISIVEKDAILEECRRIGVDGVATIASDLAAVTVGYVANELGLTCNSPRCVANSSNKTLMRRSFEKGGDPSPFSVTVTSVDDLSNTPLPYPVIVKPSDRSGSRGITKLSGPEGLPSAIESAVSESFEGCALVEEFAEGREYSVEFISWEGVHHPITITEKFTTGAPRFIEVAHLEPARLDQKTSARVYTVVSHALDSLGVTYGASHAEVKIADDGTIRIIEIGARMGGDFIGSNLVELSTGYDFVKAVIDVAMGVLPELPTRTNIRTAAVRFVLAQEDLDTLRSLRCNDSDIIVAIDEPECLAGGVTDSSNREGYALFACEDSARIMHYLPAGGE